MGQARGGTSQDDPSLAVVLFGSRVRASDLLDGNFSRSLIENGVPADFVLDLPKELTVLLK